MLVYLMRHGIAVDRADPDCPPEAKRPLTEKGARRTLAAAKGLARMVQAPDVIVSSPYRRAEETAQLVAEAFSLDRKRIERTPALLPEANPSELFAYLEQHSGKTVLCSGHAPNLDLVLAASLGAKRMSVTALKKAAVACLQFSALRAGLADLLWLAEPRFLRALADQVSDA